MLSFSFNDDSASRLLAIEQIHQIHRLDDPDFRSKDRNVPDYVQVEQFGRAKTVKVQIDEHGKGHLEARVMAVVTKFLDTRTGISCFMKEADVYQDGTLNKEACIEYLAVNYEIAAKRLWDDGYLRKHEHVIGKSYLSSQFIEVFHLFRMHLAPETTIYNEDEKRAFAASVKELVNVKHGQKSQVFKVGELSLIACQEAFAGDSLVLSGDDLALRLNEAFYDGKKVIPALDPKVDPVIEEMVQRDNSNLYHFILAGGDEQTMRHRAFFACDVYKMVQATGNWAGGSYMAEVLDRALSIEGNPKGYERSINMIDRGMFPLAVIRETFDLPTMSVAQFQKSLSHHDPFKYAAINQLPEDWFKDAYENLIYQKPSYIKLNTDVLEVGAADGRALSHAKAKGDKEAIKKIAQKWEWLSKRNALSCAQDALSQFNDKYKYNSEVLDSSEHVKDLVYGVLLRALMESDNALQESVRADFIEGLDVQIDWEMIDELMPSGSNEPFYDGTEEVFDLERVHRNIIKAAPSLSAVGKMSRKMHTNMSHITQRLGEFSQQTIQFEGVTKGEKEFEGFDFFPLDTNRKLLEEGVQQNNCVYTYLNQCLSGECAIVSMRDKEGTRIATLDIRFDGYDGVALEEALGGGNEPMPTNMKLLVERYVDNLNEEPVQINAFWEQSNDSVSKKLRDPDLKFSTLSNLSVVPFETDAAFYACELLEKYVPGGLDTVIPKATPYRQVINDTPFGQTLEKARVMSQERDVSLMQGLKMVRKEEQQQRLEQEASEQTYRRSFGR